MKTILRIIAILLVASVVAGAFTLAVNNGSTTSTQNSNGQSFQQMTRPEGGDHDSGSLGGGLAGVLGTLAKITGITILILAIQKAFSLMGNHKPMSAQQ